VDKPQVDLSMSDLLEQIVSELAITEEGMTMKEICLAKGLPATKTNLARVGSKIADLIAVGRVKCIGKRLSSSVDGRISPVPAYGLLKEEKVKKVKT